MYQQETTPISLKAKIQTTFWFMTLVAMSALWLFLWVGNDLPKKQERHQKTNISTQDLPLPAYIESYVQMTKEVPPIDFSTVIRDLRSYPKEFKDKKHFEKHAKKWTVQVMNVAQNEIITAYLDGRKDRDKFAYFRYHTTNNELRYILTYDVMNSTQEALATIKTVDFGLPEKVKLRPEEIKHYLNIMDVYERLDVGPNTSDTVKPIILTPATKVLPAQPLSGSVDRFVNKSNGENKFQNALPNLPATSINTQSATTNETASSVPTVPNKKAPATQAPSANKTAKPTPQVEAEDTHQEISLELPRTPKANIQRVNPQESSVSYGQNQGEVKYEAPRPNTNTSSVPGAGD